MSILKVKKIRVDIKYVNNYIVVLIQNLMQLIMVSNDIV